MAFRRSDKEERLRALEDILALAARQRRTVEIADIKISALGPKWMQDALLMETAEIRRLAEEIQRRSNRIIEDFVQQGLI